MDDRDATPPGRRWVWCGLHQKRAWTDRQAADASLARLTDREAMEVYPCTARPGSFHVGHKPGHVHALDRLKRAMETS